MNYCYWSVGYHVPWVGWGRKWAGNHCLNEFISLQSSHDHCVAERAHNSQEEGGLWMCGRQPTFSSMHPQPTCTGAHLCDLPEDACQCSLYSHYSEHYPENFKRDAHCRGLCNFHILALIMHLLTDWILKINISIVKYNDSLLVPWFCVHNKYLFNYDKCKDVCIAHFSWVDKH